MANCALCSVKLGFLNQPLFGQCKLGDGNVICRHCFLKLNKVNSKMAFDLKYQILTDVKNVLQRNSVNHTMSFTSVFVEPVNDKSSQPKAVTAPGFNSELSIVDQLESLGKLKEIGVLTDEEFIEQKKKLLERL